MFYCSDPLRVVVAPTVDGTTEVEAEWEKRMVGRHMRVDGVLVFILQLNIQEPGCSCIVAGNSVDVARKALQYKQRFTLQQVHSGRSERQQKLG